MGRLVRAVGGDGRAPQSAKSLCLGVFFLIAFSFAPASSKKKRMEHISFLYLRAWILACRGRRLRRPAKKHKDAFSFIVLLYDQKYQKSYKRAFPSLIYLFPRARVSRASHAWQVRAVKGGAKVGSFTTSHDFNHTTRANISHEKAEQIRARIVCTPAGYGWCGRG